MRDAAVYIVPLRIGGGTRLKIFEAMAMGKAVVSTTVGAEGLPVTDGEHVLLADDPRAFADAVVRLMRDAGAPARDSKRRRARWSSSATTGRRWPASWKQALIAVRLRRRPRDRAFTAVRDACRNARDRSAS